MHPQRGTTAEPRNNKAMFIMLKSRSIQEPIASGRRVPRVTGVFRLTVPPFKAKTGRDVSLSKRKFRKPESAPYTYTKRCGIDKYVT